MPIEILEGLKRKTTFTINKKDVTALVQTELKKYAKDAKAPGFRPGKVPSHIVEQMYGSRAYEDALKNQINKKFVDIVVDNKIDLVGYPEFDHDNKDDNVADKFVFSAIFEVMPEIKLNDFNNCEIEIPTCEFEDSIIEKSINSLCNQKCTYIDTNKIAENGDKVTIDFTGTVDGIVFDGGTATDYTFILGQGQMLADFEAGIINLNINETKPTEVKFPDTYHAENLKGKTAVFNITLKKVETAQLPELNKEFIQSIGVTDGTIETLKEEITINMQREINRRLHAKTRENILTALSNKNPIEVPSTLVHDEIHRMMDNTRDNMKKQGYPEDKIKLTHDMFNHDAKRFVTLRLLIQQFIKDNEINVNNDEIKKVVTEMAEVYEDAEEYIKWYYTDESRVNNARAIAIENKVLDLIIQKSQTKPTSIAYDELIKLPL